MAPSIEELGASLSDILILHSSGAETLNKRFDLGAKEGDEVLLEDLKSYSALLGLAT